LRRPEIVVATKNRGKMREFREIMGGLGLLDRIDLRSLSDFPDYPEAVESGETFEENALIKARAAARALAVIAVADDSGIEVDALGGKPGVRSARWAGRDATDTRNNDLLLAQLEKVPPERRVARFVATIALVSPDGTERVVRGECEGLITQAPRGTGGFGYDPIFYYPPLNKTLAEMTQAEKNRISHRRRAIEKLCEVLGEILGPRHPG
jgi:XTP/dITP diphosphohydrolase